MEYQTVTKEFFEPFVTSFTGTLTTFRSQNGRVFTLKKPHMKCVKGQHFMIAIDDAKRTCRMLPVRLPDPGYR